MLVRAVPCLYHRLPCSFLSSNINLGQGLQVSVRCPDIIIVLFTCVICCMSSLVPLRKLSIFYSITLCWIPSQMICLSMRVVDFLQVNSFH